MRAAALILCMICPCLLPAAEPVLEAGFAEVDVTPVLRKEKPVYIAGFGYNRKATAVHDPIMARAVVLTDGKEQIALVSVDVVGLFYAVTESVRKHLPAYRYILVSSTHNHEGPDTIGLWGAYAFSSGVDPEYMKLLERGIVKAIENAHANRKAVSSEIGTARDANLLHDSRLPVLKHDELVVLRFRDLKDRTNVGILVQWNCHPETLDSKNTEISADYVAATVASLREREHCPVAYFTGTVGGLMSSLKVPVKGKNGELLKDGTFEKTEAYGRLVADLASRALKDAKPLSLTPFEIRARQVYLPVDNRLYQLAWSGGVLKRDIYVWEGTPLPKKAVPAKDVEKRGAARTEIGYLRLGELEVAAIPGEIYPELVLGKIEDPADPNADYPDAPKEPAIYSQLRGKYRMLIGLANDEIGYIIPKRQWDAKAPYAYGRTKEQYGEINSLGPETAVILCETFIELVKGKR